MALNRISSPDMVNLSVDLITPGTPENTALRALAEGEVLLPRIEAAHHGIIAAQPPNDAKIADLTAKLTIKDVRHDTLVRSLDGRIESELLHVTDPAAVEALTRARIALFPTGLGIINASYGAQAGEVQLRAKRVDDSVRATLGRLRTYDGRTCADLYDELQQVATEIGALEKLRAALGEEGAQIAKSRDARNQWIRAIHAVAAMLALAGVDERPILGAIREAELEADRAAARAAARKSGPQDPTTTTTTTTTGTPNPGAPTDLDPPIPVDPSDPSDA